MLKFGKEPLEASCPARISKRVILSASHKIFDPLGFVCPILLRPKLLLQTVWVRRMGWDEEVSQDIEKPFIQCFQELPMLAGLDIPRKMYGDLKRGSLKFHVVVVPIQVTYGVAIFARTQTQKSVVIMSIEATSRVAPNEVVMIPRFLGKNGGRLPSGSGDFQKNGPPGSIHLMKNKLITS